jgi:Family of unknown function (DUF6084)
MPELEFSVESVSTVSGTLTPVLRFRLRAQEASGSRVDTVALSCQIMIETRRRTYQPREQEALLDLFDRPSRWGDTLKTMLWTHAATMVPGFDQETRFDLDVQCSSDVTVAAGKYFHALESGDVPLTFQFSGTVFYAAEDGSLQISRIAWTKEATFRLPVATWRQMMSEHYPEGTWICIRTDVFDRLHRYKSRRGTPTWDGVFGALLDASEEKVSP